VGLGCCLINMRVFHRIGRKLDWQCLMPHGPGDEAYSMEYDRAKSLNFACDKCGGVLVAKFFEDRIGKAKTSAISEDFFFCHRARSFGFHIMVYLRAVVNHEMNHGFEIGQQGLLNTVTNSAITK
jgi:ribosomal protein S27AE